MYIIVEQKISTDIGHKLYVTPKVLPPSLIRSALASSESSLELVPSDMGETSGSFSQKALL